MTRDLDPVDRITTDAIGPPGARIFYLQARGREELVTLLVEKEQVELLAASIVDILAKVGKEVSESPAEQDMALEEPLEPGWRVGRLSIGYEEGRDVLVLEAEELLLDDAGEQEARRVRMWASREQMLALARHGVEVCARGRPRCRLCGNPIDVDGHRCPALNGHREA